MNQIFEAYLRVEEAVKQEDKETLKKFSRRWFYTRALRRMLQRTFPVHKDLLVVSWIQQKYRGKPKSVCWLQGCQRSRKFRGWAGGPPPPSQSTSEQVKAKALLLFWLLKRTRCCRATNSLDCIGVSVNLVALSTDPRYDPGDQYEDANVHLETSERVGLGQRLYPRGDSLHQSPHHNDKHGRCNKGPDGSIRQRQPATKRARERERERDVNVNWHM